MNGGLSILQMFVVTRRCCAALLPNAAEFRQLVEERHAVMGERDRARPGGQAAADQPLQGDRMVQIGCRASATPSIDLRESGEPIIR
jgi:hypothetical protein